VPQQFFPFHILQFNRVTGEFFGPSDLELLRPLQEELNMLRTHDREARKSAYPRYMVTKGLLGKRAKHDMRMAAPYSVIEVEKANEVKANIHELTPASYAPTLYDGGRARTDFEMMSGMSSAGLGGASSGATATAEAIANQQLGVQSDRRKDIVTEFLQRIYKAMTEINAQLLGGNNAKMLAGPGADWLADSMTREQILGDFMLEVEAAPNSAAERQQDLQNLNTLASMAASLGMPANRLQLFLDGIRLMGVRANPSRYIDINALMNPQPMGEPGSAPAPEEQGDRGAEGGRPSNAERGDNEVSNPESIPNRPQV
jgi:hypothetical protein